jgi:ParB family chromosome partitioning protein
MTDRPLGRGLGSLIPQKKAPTLPVRPVPLPPARPVPPTAAPVVPLPAPVAHTPAVRPAVVATPSLHPTLGSSQRVYDIPVGLIDPNPHQPRHRIQEDTISELVDSIRQHGILQPLIVTKVGERYQLIAGERRFRSSQQLGLPTVPALIRETRELEQLEIAIVENVQRQDLNPIEEALAYQQLAEEFGLTQEEIAKKVGKSRATVANALRILSLPPSMQAALRDGRLSSSHAKIILTAVTPEERERLFDQIVNQKLPVRAAASLGQQTTVRRHTRRKVDPVLQAAEDELRNRFATKVTITKREHRGTIAIEFYSDEEFQQLLQQLRD